MLLGELVPGRLDPLADAAVVLVHQPWPEHAVRDLLAVHLCRQRRLELGHALGFLAHEVAEISRARELPQFARTAVPVDRHSERERRVEPGQTFVTLVDRSQLVGVLVPCEVEVGLLVELRDEAVGLRAERVDLPLLKRLRHAGS